MGAFQSKGHTTISVDVKLVQAGTIEAALNRSDRFKAAYFGLSIGDYGKCTCMLYVVSCLVFAVVLVCLFGLGRECFCSTPWVVLLNFLTLIPP
jgi:hypothetical protein